MGKAWETQRLGSKAQWDSSRTCVTRAASCEAWRGARRGAIYGITAITVAATEDRTNTDDDNQRVRTQPLLCLGQAFAAEAAMRRSFRSFHGAPPILAGGRCLGHALAAEAAIVMWRSLLWSSGVILSWARTWTAATGIANVSTLSVIDAAIRVISDVGTILDAAIRVVTHVTVGMITGAVTGEGACGGGGEAQEACRIRPPAITDTAITDGVLAGMILTETVSSWTKIRRKGRWCVIGGLGREGLGWRPASVRKRQSRNVSRYPVRPACRARVKGRHTASGI